GAPVREARLGAQRECGGDVPLARAAAAVEVGGGARDAQQPVQPASAEDVAIQHAAQQLLSLLVERQVPAQRGRVELAVHAHRLPAQPPRLACARVHDLLACTGGVGGGRRAEIGACGPAEVRDEVDAVQERSAEATAVAGEVAFAADAYAVLAEVPAGAGVGRGDEREARGV